MKLHTPPERNPQVYQIGHVAVDLIRLDLLLQERKPQVLIAVRDGVAYVEDCPEGVEVRIVDHDNEAAA